ncbi:MAG: hypothetical protein AB8B72_09925 [Crocinitomicaceae bacterium]
MENEVIDAGTGTGQGIISDSEIKSYLLETAKWSKFLSILGFIGIGFMVIGALFAGVALGSQVGMRSSGMPFPPALLSLVYLLMALLYFFPIYYLYNFAVKMKGGLLSGDNSVLRESFKNLKSHYKFIGIFTIVILSLYVLGILVFIFAAASMR